METELSAGDTLQLLTALQTAMRKGIRQVWLHRNKARQDWVRANKKSLWQRRDAALKALLHRYQQRGVEAPDGMAQHVKNLRGKGLRKWIAKQEQHQRSITEFFHRAATSQVEKRAAVRRRATVAAAHGASSPPCFTQLSLVGCPPQGDAGQHTLAFSRHLPAHALQDDSGPLRAAGPLKKKNAKPADRPLPSHGLQRKLQMKLTCSSGSLLLAAPPLCTGQKRRASAPPGDERSGKLLRSSSFRPSLLRTRKRATCTTTPSPAAAGLKRKHSKEKRKGAANRLKRKAASGSKTTNRNQAHSTGSDLIEHRAAGSVQVDGKNAADTLQTSTMRMPD